MTRDDIASIYRDLLGRECTDGIALEALTRLPASEVVDIVLSSGKFRGGVMCRPGRRDIEELFDLLLKRDVESETVMKRHLEIPTLRDVVAVLTKSTEFRERILRSHLMETNQVADVARSSRRPSNKILCFGAYGNGNLGDLEQADAIADILMKAGAKSSDLYACSWETGGDLLYPFPGRKLPRSAVLDFSRICEMGLVVIGGGGILGTPHFPLHDERWVEALRATGVPYVLWAVGGGSDHLHDPQYATAYASLLCGAAMVSARDAESLQAFRTVRPDATFLDDPLLRKALLAPLVAPPRGNRVEAILKFPVNDNERRFLSAFEALYARTSRERLGVVFLELKEPEERIAMKAFPGARAASSSQELASLLEGASVGCSMRLHGAGAIVQGGLPLVGLSHPKIRSFMTTIGLEDQFVAEPGDQLFNRIAADELSGFKAAKRTGSLARSVEKRQAQFTDDVMRLIA